MKMTVISICSNTLVPRSPDRWHATAKAFPQLSAASRQRRAVTRQSTSLLHFIHHQNNMTNMFRFSIDSAEYAIMAYLHHVLFQSNKNWMSEKQGSMWLITLKKITKRPYLWQNDFSVMLLWACICLYQYFNYCKQISMITFAHSQESGDVNRKIGQTQVNFCLKITECADDRWKYHMHS